MNLKRFLRDRRDWLLTIGLVSVAAGFVVIGLGWFGAARKDTVPEQFPYVISGGFTGLGLLITGAALLITQSFRRDHDRLHERLTELQEDRGLGLTTEELTSLTSTDGFVVAGRASFHDPSCHLVAERDPSDMLTVDEAEERGLEACRVCEPMSVR